MSGSAIPKILRQWFFAAVLGLFVLAAGWRILSLAVADLYANSDPELATRWVPSHPQALLKLAESRIAQGRVDEAEALARHSLEQAPLDGRGYRVLAHAAATHGDRTREQALVDIAVKHGPRDIYAQAEAAQLALEHGDAQTAVRRYTQIVSLTPDAKPAVFSVFAQLAAQSGASDALVAELGRRPEWRAEYLVWYANATPSLDDMSAFFRQLRAAGGLDPVETSAWVERLVREREWDRAFVVWVDSLPRNALSQLAFPNDGGFENLRINGGPFEWNIHSVPGVDVAIRPAPAGSGNALNVEFQGRRAPFRDVRQLLLLPPGAGYRLEWRSQLNALETERGMQWTLTCADGAGGQILATPLEKGETRWRTKFADFSVPPDCPAQWLVLQLGARIPAEALAIGSAWFDDVKVSRATPTQGIETAVTVVKSP